MYVVCVWYYTATHCNTLQHTATQETDVCCVCVVIHCNTLQHTATQETAVCCVCVVIHCNTLQHTATHCNTLQHRRLLYVVCVL